jgi:hypothetical protein
MTEAKMQAQVRATTSTLEALLVVLHRKHIIDDHDGNLIFDIAELPMHSQLYPEAELTGEVLRSMRAKVRRR